MARAIDINVHANSSIRNVAAADSTATSNVMNIFALRRLDDEVKLVGTTFNCHFGPDNWHLQSMALATDGVGMEEVMQEYLREDVCFSEKVDAIYGGEIRLSQSYLDRGYGLFALSSLMMGQAVKLGNTEVVKSICSMWQPRTTQVGRKERSDDAPCEGERSAAKRRQRVEASKARRAPNTPQRRCDISSEHLRILHAGSSMRLSSLQARSKTAS